MTTLIILAITHSIAVIGGILIGLKNADSSKVAKAKEIAEIVKK